MNAFCICFAIVGVGKPKCTLLKFIENIGDSYVFAIFLFCFFFIYFFLSSFYHCHAYSFPTGPIFSFYRCVFFSFYFLHLHNIKRRHSKSVRLIYFNRHTTHSYPLLIHVCLCIQGRLQASDVMIILLENTIHENVRSVYYFALYAYNV